MKTAVCLMIGASALPNPEPAKLTHCPGRCWKLDDKNENCILQPGKVLLDCGSTGRIKFWADSCLFTQDSADYDNQVYKVHTTIEDPSQPGSFMRNPNTQCVKEIKTAQDILEWDLTYEEARSCGFIWGQNNDQKLTFTGNLRPTDNVNDIFYKGFRIENSAFPDDMMLQCIYDNKAEFSTDYLTAPPTTGQVADTVSNIPASLAAGFQFTPEKTIFFVGDEMTFNLKYDFQKAGYDAGSLSDMPFGFFFTKCHVKNKKAEPDQLFLMGSDDGSLNDQCIDEQLSDLNINLASSGTSKYWSSSDITFGFDAFKLNDEADLNLICDVEICLADKCPATDPVCVNPPPTNPCENVRCDHKCIVMDGLAVCECNVGFTLNTDGSTCDEIPQIHPCNLGNGGCQEVCLKEGDVAICACPSGFKLLDDLKSCALKNCHGSDWRNSKGYGCKDADSTICEAGQVKDGIFPDDLIANGFDKCTVCGCTEA